MLFSMWKKDKQEFQIWGHNTCLEKLNQENEYTVSIKYR